MNDLIERLRKRAEIRRQISTRKSVQEGKPDRIADLLEEAADALVAMRETIEQGGHPQGTEAKQTRGSRAYANGSAESGANPDPAPEPPPWLCGTCGRDWESHVQAWDDDGPFLQCPAITLGI